MAWIVQEMKHLLDSGYPTPMTNTFFDGMQRTWADIQSYREADPMEEAEDDPMYDAEFEQEGGRLEVRNPAPVIAGTAAGEALRLVDYSDSDDDSEPDTDSPHPLPAEHFFELSDPVDTYVKKFCIQGKAFTMRFKNHDQMQDVDQVMLEVFRKILSDSFQHGNPTDMVGVQIQHPSLYRGAFNIPFQSMLEQRKT
ncbi:MAG: hypothetical protein GY696_18020 [Gammaproteobacteria bacterium]|nr:hypothetical protein [Gammaproteobacteria bacterium]